ncbi:hypothetical protein SLS55_002309 [Diplodia seriata]|uniref:RING-type domain-containing protein n=1 Tax=Diplodia seriata TaxID=420778 RepID=A0A0G2DV45_9PEZI|nr:hypothetical protein UCDDS831_g08184 [Diplodia seriata]
MAYCTSTLVFPRTSDKEAVCNLCFEYGGAARNEPIFALPCGCNLHLSCLTLAFKTQHAMACFFNCPACYADLNSTGERSRELTPPSGTLLKIETIGDHNQVSVFHDEDSEDVTGHLVYREHYDSAAGTLMISVTRVLENAILF